MPATNDNCVEKTVQSISMTKCIVRRSKRRRTSHSVRQSTTRRQLISVAIIIAIHFVEPAERTSSECLTESAQEPNAKREMQRRRKLVFLMKYKMPACHFACGVFPCIFRSVFFFSFAIDVVVPQHFLFLYWTPIYQALFMIMGQLFIVRALSFLCWLHINFISVENVCILVRRLRSS